MGIGRVGVGRSGQRRAGRAVTAVAVETPRRPRNLHGTRFGALYVHAVDWPNLHEVAA
jgi:hypothetical protein